MRLSIIIPVLDEGERISPVLESFAETRERGTELVIVDGGSRDATIQRARLRSDIVLSAPRGVASQLNAGAAKATGDVVLFLRAGMQLPSHSDVLVLDGLERTGRHWGFFGVKLSGDALFLPIASGLINVQSWITGITADEQAVFVKRNVFRNAGGFPAITELEHIALCRALKRIGRPLRLRQRIVAPAGKWESLGIRRTLQERSRRRFGLSSDGNNTGAPPKSVAAAVPKD
jgi:glycosyltransferase involved in cell wall biosynthesis